jgi:hypothetical protein
MNNRTKLASTVYECLREPVAMGIDAFRRGTWNCAPSMSTPRAHHTATRIGDDALLVAGGRAEGGKPTVRAEIFDAHAQAWNDVAPMKIARSHHVAVKLTNGHVLVLGGTRLHGAQGATAECEIWNPIGHSWYRAASMSHARTRHAAARLRDGTVLVTGGCGEEGRLPHAEIYDPNTDTWREIAPMRGARSDHSLTAIDSGRVLAAGRSASGGDGCEVYEIATNRWLRRVNPPRTPTAHTATLLPDGAVLLAGGIDPRGTSMAGAQIYYPRWSTWDEADAHTACDAHASVALLDGGVALLGGVRRSRDAQVPDVLEQCMIFDPEGGTWSRGPAMPTARHGHTATLLPNAGIIVAGGYDTFDASVALASCDIFTPSWEGFSRVT